MTDKEAIKRLKEARNTIQPFQYVDEAIDYAVKVLEQESCEDAIKYFNTIYELSQTLGVSYDFIDEKIKEIVTAFKEKALLPITPQSCEDVISRQAAKQAIRERFLNLYERVEINTVLNELPSIKPEQKTGHWIKLDECSNSGYYCSECYKKVVKEGWSGTVKRIKYCPNCGAKMEV